jgi:4-alpha-glucanotransferase
VPDEIRDAMTDHGMLGMYVAEFNQPAWAGAELGTPTAGQLATIDTHDTPTFTGWVHGFDIDMRHQLGLVDDDAAERERAERRQQIENLAGFLTARGDLPDGRRPRRGERADDAFSATLLEGLLRFLGDSDAPAVFVALDDLVGETNPQNVPGTMVDRPNWVQRFTMTIDDLVADGRIMALLGALQDCRLGSHLRAREGEGAEPDDDRERA